MKQVSSKAAIYINEYCEFPAARKMHSPQVSGQPHFQALLLIIA
jgi:hypothetical protein